jgi:hypothetical protein
MAHMGGARMPCLAVESAGSTRVSITRYAFISPLRLSGPYAATRHSQVYMALFLLVLWLSLDFRRGNAIACLPTFTQGAGRKASCHSQRHETPVTNAVEEWERKCSQRHQTLICAR